MQFIESNDAEFFVGGSGSEICSAGGSGAPLIRILLLNWYFNVLFTFLGVYFDFCLQFPVVMNNLIGSMDGRTYRAQNIYKIPVVVHYNQQRSRFGKSSVFH